MGQQVDNAAFDVLGPAPLPENQRTIPRRRSPFQLSQANSPKRNALLKVAKETFWKYAPIAGAIGRDCLGRDDRPFGVSAAISGETGLKRERALARSGARSKVAEDNSKCDKPSLLYWFEFPVLGRFTGIWPRTGRFAPMAIQVPARRHRIRAVQRRIPYSP